MLRSYLPAGHSKLFIVTEECIWNAVGAPIGHITDDILFLPGGEETKRLASLEPLAEQMVERGADRSSVIIGFGGGIVTDMAGFLAAIFMRGIPVVHVPTTLLAQVDAAVGGKTGVNLRSGKNLIGSFHQPFAVLVDPQALSTLPEREYRAGLYEVIKIAIISSVEFFGFLQENRNAILGRDPAMLDRAISECLQIKADVVAADERESGSRAILNFGHTVGHAIEAETHYARYLHGEAVGLGMKVAAQLAHEQSGLPIQTLESITALIDSYGPLPAASDLVPGNLYSRLTRDKKTRKGQIRFVLPSAIGEVGVYRDIPELSVLRAIRDGLT